MSGYTFGERLAAMEESIEALAQIVDIMMKAMGILDENGEWVEVDVDPAEAGEAAT